MGVFISYASILLVSGFLFAYTHPENKMKGMRFFPFIWKKVKRLLLPFLFINSVIFVINHVLFLPI